VGEQVKAFLKVAAPWVIGALTILVIAANLNIDPIMLERYASDVFLCVLVTALTVYFSVLLTETEISISHAAGMLYFVSLEGRALPIMTLAVCAGALAGSLVALLRGRLRPLNPALAGAPRNYVMLVARVVLSFWAAARVYIATGGALPLRDLDTILDNMWEIAIYAAVYMALYLLLLVLEAFASNLHLLRADIPRIGVVMLLPLPLVIMGTEIRNQLDDASTVLYSLGLVFIVIALHGLSVSEFRLRRRLAESRAYAALSRVVQMDLDRAGLLRALCAQAGHVLGTNNFTAALFDAERGGLYYALVTVHGDERAALVGQTVPPDTLTAYTAYTGQALLAPENVTGYCRALNLASPDAEIASWVGVPMAAGGHVIGVLAAESRDPRRLFGEADLTMLSAIAASGSIAMENAQLYQHQRARAEQMAVLNRMVSLMSANLAFDQVVDSVLEAGRTIAHADAVSLYLQRDDAEQPLTVERSVGLAAAAQRELQVSLWQQRARAGSEPLIIEDLANGNPVAQDDGAIVIEAIRSVVEMPLVAGDRMLGVLALYFRAPQRHTEDTLELFKTFGLQCAQALDNARKYTSTDAALQRSAEQLSALAEVSRLLTSTLHLDEIGRLILDYATATTRASSGLIALLDDNPGIAPGTMTVAAVQGGTRRPSRRLTLPDHPLYLRTLESREMQHVERLTRSIPYAPVSPTAGSALLLPLLRGEQVIGLMALETGQGDSFSPEDIDYTRQLASSAVIALDNARLFASIAQDRDRLKVLLNTMEEGMIVINTAGIVTLANPRVDLIGLRPSEIIGQPFRTLIVDPRLGLARRLGFADADAARQLIQDMGTLDTATTVNYTFSSERGEVYLQRAAVPIHGQQGRVIGLLLVLYNKTEEYQLARSREDLTRMLVHDLRSPMTAVTTSLKLIGELTPKDSPQHATILDAVGASRRAVKKVLNRLDALLDIARMDHGQLELELGIVEIGKLVDTVFADLSPLAQEIDVALINAVTPETRPVSVDADKIERVLMNLVDNALKYTPAGGSVTVRASLAADDNLQVEVSDTGPGIPDAYKERLFDHFVQVDGRERVRRGVGLGLTFCRLVVTAHGGRIWIEDNRGGGSAFVFTLPLVPTEVLEDE
jgi:signal transduction histidine kinase